MSPLSIWQHYQSPPYHAHTHATPQVGSDPLLVGSHYVYTWQVAGMTCVFCQLNSPCDPALFEPIRVKISFHLHFGYGREFSHKRQLRLANCHPSYAACKSNMEGFFTEPLNQSKKTTRGGGGSQFLHIICVASSRQVILFSFFLDLSRNVIQA